MNGSMFVSQDEVTEETLTPEELERVTVTETDEEGNSTETALENAICDNILHWPEGWLFNLREPSAEEQERKAMETRLNEAEAALIELAGMIGGM